MHDVQAKCVKKKVFHAWSNLERSLKVCTMPMPHGLQEKGCYRTICVSAAAACVRLASLGIDPLQDTSARVWGFRVRIYGLQWKCVQCQCLMARAATAPFTFRLLLARGLASSDVVRFAAGVDPLQDASAAR